MRSTDGSAGDVDYGHIGQGYARFRQPEPRIAEAIGDALGEARTVLNVGAGAGSYEPRDRAVTAVEPSETMRTQRPADVPAAIDAVAEDLPFGDKAFDAAMATFTVHQWSDFRAGLREIRRVTAGPVVILTADPDALRRFWLDAYLPEVLDVEASRYPAIGDIAAVLGDHTEIREVPVPLDCRDGFAEAYYGRPEMFLDEEVRRAMSAFSFVSERAIARFVARLRDDVRSGKWDRTYGHLRTQPTFSGSLRLVVG